MHNILRISIAGFILVASAHVFAGGTQMEIDQAKQEIIALAQTFEGQGDPQFAKQRALEPLIQRLLELSPQPPVKDRLKLLYGAWKQVWGPYEYQNDGRGVDPELGVREIYQVIFPGGYYYNVSPNYKDGDPRKERIGLLRGKFKLHPSDPNKLKVRFTNLRRVKTRPLNLKLWELPALSEADKLRNEKTVLPGIFVRLFFSKGALREVYTDADLRILYGSDSDIFEREYVYVMTKVK